MRPPRLVASSTLIIQACLLLLAVVLTAHAQPATDKWQRIAPDDEEFTVLMPSAPQITREKKPFGQVTVTSNTYAFASIDGTLYMISSVSGIETFSAMLPDKEKLNTYAEGFWNGFLKAVRDKGLRAEATYVRELKLNGHLGGAYDVLMGDIRGLAHVYSTRKKFYALMIFNAPEDDPRIARFLDSFTLRSDAAPKAGPVGGVVSGPVIIPQTNIGNRSAQSDEPPPEPAASTPKVTQPIHGGVLNGKAISLPKPIYPSEAREARVSGQVTVQILVDENGDVIQARAVSGHPLLQPAAVAAASRAKFSQTRLQGQPVKVTGVVTYNFIGQ